MLTFPSTMKEELHNKHLESGHSNHNEHLDKGEFEDSRLRGADCREVSIFSCPKVFLIARDSRELSRDLEERFL